MIRLGKNEKHGYFFRAHEKYKTKKAKYQENVSDTIYSYFFNQEFDLMFSGHTCVFIFIGKVLDNELGLYVQLMLPITLIMARQHYSIDVLCSMFVYNYFYSQDFNLSLN